MVTTQVPFMSQVPSSHTPTPSEHAPPAGTGSATQSPVTMSQTPLLQPMVRAEQSFGVPPMHWPSLHVLPTLQRLPLREQASPFLVGSIMPSHMPFAGLQTAVLHSPTGAKVQSFGVPMH